MSEHYYDPWSNTKTISGLDADLVISALQKFVRRAEETEALRVAFELYKTSEFHENKMWSRLLVMSVEDIGFGDTYAPVYVQTLDDMRQKFAYEDGDRPLFFVQAIRYLCKCKKERSSDHIKNILMKEFDRGYVPEIPDYAVDMHTIKGRAMGRDVFYFLEESSKVSPVWEDYDDSYRQKFYQLCKEECDKEER